MTDLSPKKGWPVAVAHAPNPPHRCRPQRTAHRSNNGIHILHNQKPKCNVVTAVAKTHVLL